MLSAMPVVDLVGGAQFGAVARRGSCCDDCSCGCGNCCPGCSGNVRINTSSPRFLVESAMRTALVPGSVVPRAALSGIFGDDLPLPGAPIPMPTTPGGSANSEIPVALVVAGTAALIAGTVAIGFFYNRWAYGDWTCMFKACVQSSTKRR
jgi:hypothetical protein